MSELRSNRTPESCSSSANHNIRCILPLVLSGVVLLSSCTTHITSQKSKRTVETSFSISNSFYGRLTEEQERQVPQTMQGAFCIEPVRNISSSDLKQIAQKKQFIAEELQNGAHYVALRDLRFVQFDTFSAGLMVYIEKYRIADY